MAHKINLFHLYRHFDKQGNLLYVGQSLNAIFRLIQHFGMSSWAVDIAFIEVDRFSSAEELKHAENRAIAEEGPLHNRTIPALAVASRRPAKPKVKSDKPRGRPPILEDRPWDLAGMSRRTWYRKNKSAKVDE